MSETTRQARAAYEAWSEGRSPIEAGPYEAFLAGYRAALRITGPEPTDAAQGALFDLPSAKPINAIAEGR